jgi:hypothetical protein
MREGCGRFQIGGSAKNGLTINARYPVLAGIAGGVAALPRTAHAVILWKGNAPVKRKCG